MTKIIAVTACPSGVAHTYMAAEALESAAKAKGWEVKVETQGSIGLENELTAEDVASADMVILTKISASSLKSVLLARPSCASTSAMQ
ncbi:fructose-like specific PTS system EIIB component 2) [Escherichia coli]|uniref:protein-N(pi)-phosphohistidine--D-fructose phosphotransferase n=1 Tax=Escherichia coli TaxID=562 RepID=A0A376U0Q6_ECOLX|nr:fructose-like specific PTS system EIIB component 2) [Escherichia coli]